MANATAIIAIRRPIAADMDNASVTITLPQWSASAFWHSVCLPRSPRSTTMTIIRAAITRPRHAPATADTTDTVVRHIQTKCAGDSLLDASLDKRWPARDSHLAGRLLIEKRLECF